MKTFPALLKIPYHYLYSAVIMLAFIGAYMSTNSFFGLIVALFFCILGVLFDCFGVPSLPFLMTFILSPMLEINIRRGMSYSNNGLSEFFSFARHPISASFIILGILVLIFGFLGPVLKKLKKAKPEAEG